MKKLALLFLFLIVVISIPLFWVFINILPASSAINKITFNIPKGSGASQIGQSLFEKGIIKNPIIFKVYVQYSGISSNIQAGDYSLSPSYNLFQIVDILSKTPLSTKVTIPEGFTHQEIAEKFAKSLNRDKSFVNEFLTLSKNDEGYLFPDTYLVPNNISPKVIIEKMKAEFESKTQKLKPTRDQVILASIIERETKGIEERPVVAGILTNRLNAGMALQVDIAPITYKEVGLPTAPIANPGLVSIEAAVRPSRTDYWYYLHDPSGTIHYAKTLDEQNININKYLR